MCVNVRNAINAYILSINVTIESQRLLELKWIGSINIAEHSPPTNVPPVIWVLVSEIVQHLINKSIKTTKVLCWTTNPINWLSYNKLYNNVRSYWRMLLLRGRLHRCAVSQRICSPRKSRMVISKRRILRRKIFDHFEIQLEWKNWKLFAPCRHSLINTIE